MQFDTQFDYSQNNQNWQVPHNEEYTSPTEQYSPGIDENGTPIQNNIDQHYPEQHSELTKSQDQTEANTQQITGEPQQPSVFNNNNPNHSISKYVTGEWKTPKYGPFIIQIATHTAYKYAEYAKAIINRHSSLEAEVASVNGNFVVRIKKRYNDRAQCIRDHERLLKQVPESVLKGINSSRIISG